MAEPTAANEDGVLRPAAVLTELEARMLANPKLVRRIEANRRDPDRLVRRTRRR